MSKLSISIPNWLIVRSKLDFFARIRRFLMKGKSCKKQNKITHQIDGKTEVVDRDTKEENQENQENDKGKQGRLSDDTENWMVLQRAVKRLHFGTWAEKEEAAKEITRLVKDDMKRRKLMVELGVIQPLVDMVGSEVVQRQRSAVQALIELSNGSFTNKVVIMEAGLLPKLPNEVDSLDESTKQEYALLVFSLSSISTNSFPLKSSQMITLVLNILDSNPKIETALLCLKTLHNLSLVLENAGNLVHCKVLNILLRSCSTRETSEKALATLENLAVTLMGRKALENHPMVPENFIEILAKQENPKCQEFSSYILMILAHQSALQRDKMAKANIVPVLLEVALLGSPLAQKRSLKLLQWFKDDRQVRMGPHSGPQYQRMKITNSPTNDGEVEEGSKLMTNIVKQSLIKNLERITRRANGTSGSASLKALVVSSSSKSLPY